MEDGLGHVFLFGGRISTKIIFVHILVCIGKIFNKRYSVHLDIASYCALRKHNKKWTKFGALDTSEYNYNMIWYLIIHMPKASHNSLWCLLLLLLLLLTRILLFSCCYIWPFKDYMRRAVINLHSLISNLISVVLWFIRL